MNILTSHWLTNDLIFVSGLCMHRNISTHFQISLCQLISRYRRLFCECVRTVYTVHIRVSTHMVERVLRVEKAPGTIVEMRLS